MVLMPLILIVLRVVNTNRLSSEMSPEPGSFGSEILTYAEGMIATAGVLYVFLILTGISCNLFAFEEERDANLDSVSSGACQNFAWEEHCRDRDGGDLFQRSAADERNYLW